MAEFAAGLARALSRSGGHADPSIAAGAVLADVLPMLAVAFGLVLDRERRAVASAAAASDGGGVGLRKRSLLMNAGEAVLEGDLEAVRADILALPLMYDGRILGALVLQSDLPFERKGFPEAVQLLASCIAGLVHETPQITVQEPQDRSGVSERLVEAIASHREGMALFGPDRGLVAANAAFTAAHGAVVRDLKGLTLVEILRRNHDGIGPLWIGRDVAAGRDASGVELALAADGRWLRLSRSRSPAGDELVVQTPADDALSRLAEGRRREVTAANAAAAHERLWDGLGVGAILLSENSRILDANVEASRLLRVERDDLIGRRLGRLADGLSDDWATIGRPRGGGGAIAAKVRRLPDRQALLVLTELPDTPSGTGVVEQRADLVENPTEMAATRAISELGHEMRTPLNAIIGFAEIMLARSFGPVNDRQAQYLNDIVMAGQHMLEMVDHMLDHAQLSAGRYPYEPEWTGLRGLGAEAVRMLETTAAKAGVEVKLEPLEDLEAFIDRRGILQSLINLLSNAVKFTPSGGRVRLKIDRRPDGLYFVVNDTGEGIDSVDLERVMEPFTQVRRLGGQPLKGVGLGLAIVGAIASLHDGEVSIVSEKGEGAEVTLKLPLGRVRPVSQDA